jgi:hypothetical protein
MTKLYHFLRYLTNNLKQSKHETEWDIMFFLIIVVSLLCGIGLLIAKQMQEWIPFLLVEAVWCCDNLRHNRP